MTSDCDTLIRRQLLTPVPEPLSAMASQVRGRHDDVLAVIAYGSALRDTNPADTLIDLYVLTGSNQGVSRNFISRVGCALVPPNVHYAECQAAGQTYRCKYAVMPLPQLARKLDHRISHPYFWARFAQPMQLAWCKDAAVAEQVVACLLAAARTAYANAKGSLPLAAPLDQWSHLFRETYHTELRPESEDRAQQIVSANRCHYEGLAQSLADIAPVRPHWKLRRVVGKALSVVRLAKAAFTFQGGADYIAWKIKRHSGIAIEVTEFQRRHPLLAGLMLLPRLLRLGAVR